MYVSHASADVALRHRQTHSGRETKPAVCVALGTYYSRVAVGCSPHAFESRPDTVCCPWRRTLFLKVGHERTKETNLVDRDVPLSALDEEREVEHVLHGLRRPTRDGRTEGRTEGMGDVYPSRRGKISSLFTLGYIGPCLICAHPEQPLEHRRYSRRGSRDDASGPTIYNLCRITRAVRKYVNTRAPTNTTNRSSPTCVNDLGLRRTSNMSCFFIWFPDSLSAFCHTKRDKEERGRARRGVSHARHMICWANHRVSLSFEMGHRFPPFLMPETTQAHAPHHGR